jgi:hypothetical protein
MENVNRAYEKLRANNDSNYVIDGLKDIPITNMFPYCYMVMSECIDGMHQFQGIFKTLTFLWSKPKFKTYSFNLKPQVWESFCKSYSNQKNVAMFKRGFRSPNEHSGHYKVIEALLFIVYSFPLLKKKFSNPSIMIITCY